MQKLNTTGRLTIIFTFLAAIFLLHYAIAGQAVYGDGIDYWVYLHSGYVDHDIDFTNEYRHYYDPARNNTVTETLAPEVMKTPLTAKGIADNPHTPGTAVLLFPFYILADGLARIFGLPANGYSDIYQIVTGLGAIGYVTAGTYYFYQFIRHFFEEKPAGWATAALLATPLLYYGSYDVINSHFASFFLTSLLMYSVVKYPAKQGWIGLLFSLLVLVRLQDGLWLLPLVLVLRPGKRFWLGALVWLPILIVIWLSLYGVPYPVYYLTRGHIFRGFWGCLFDPVTGWFMRTPITLIGLAGIPFGLKKPSLQRLVLVLLGLFGFTYALVTYQGGWQDPAYGGRMFLGMLPLLGLLIAGLFEKFKKAAPVLIVGLILFNCWSIARFVLVDKEVQSGQKRGLEEQTVRKIQQLKIKYGFDVAP